MAEEEIKIMYISPDGVITNKDTESRGFLRYLIVKDSPDYADYVELRQIFINPKSRKQGHGKKFIRFLVGVAHLHDLKAIYVATTTLESEVFGSFLVATGFRRRIKLKKPEDLLPQNMPHFPFKKRIRKYEPKAKRKSRGNSA